MNRKKKILQISCVHLSLQGFKKKYIYSVYIRSKVQFWGGTTDTVKVVFYSCKLWCNSSHYSPWSLQVCRGLCAISSPRGITQVCWRTFDFSCNPTQQALSLLLCGPPSGSCFSFIRAAKKRLLFRSNQRHFSSSFSAAATWYGPTREAKARLQSSYESSDAALRQCRWLRSSWGDILQNIFIFILKSPFPQIG